MLRGNKYIGAGIEAGKVTLKHTERAARSLWLQVTGFIFCVFALTGAFACRREYAALQGPWTANPRFSATLLFTLLFAYLGVSSFLKARRHG